MNEQLTNIEQRLFDYYDGKLKGAELYEVKSWIEASDEHRRIARRIYSLLLAVDVHEAQKETDTEKALKKVKGKGIVNRRTGNWWQWAQRAAAVLFLPLLTLIVWQQVRIAQDERLAETFEIRTNPGMTTRLTLPDGTLVYLNSGSVLSYPSKFVEDARTVSLSGEAYFEVAKDPQRRFIVHTPQQSAVEVLGTHFNVEAYENDACITTTLTEGEVRFLYRDGRGMKRAMLLPGQKLVYDVSTHELTRYETSGKSELSWKDGQIIFDNTPLPEALRMLGKRFNVDFIVKNPSLNKNRFTGTFTTQRLEKILKYFEISSHIHWRYLNDPNINQEKIQIEIY